MQNIESLLNNTVAPNVSLTRANSVVPDSQLSPGFSPSQLMQQQLSPNQRTQLSPQQTGSMTRTPCPDFLNLTSNKFLPQVSRAVRSTTTPCIGCPRSRWVDSRSSSSSSRERPEVSS